MGCVQEQRDHGRAGGPLARLRRFLRDRRGVTAIEVAMIMPVFLLIMFGIFEIAMLYFVAAALEGQVAEASRQIRTGNVQGEADPLSAFRSLLCGPLEIAIDCDEIIVDVRKYSTFSIVTYPEFIDEDGEPDEAQFLPGAAREIVVVRASYRWDLLVPGMGLYLGDNGNPYKTLSATAVFRNEPFES
ncbi:MAG: pilus assembly protein [Alphaproteobacteria bacterium]